MKKNILITGANGMLSKELSKHLDKEYSIRYLTRKVKRENEFLWDLQTGYIDPHALEDVNIVIHLAGASVADSRWTKARKELILSSRVESAQLILAELKKNNITLDAFISASAVGYYGNTTSDVVYNEASKKGEDFLSDVCRQWEAAANAFESEKVASRVVVLRIGIILAKGEGALEKITTPIKYGVGSGIGSGEQYMPWIHIQDLCRLFNFVISHKNKKGTYNAVSPEHIKNIDLTRRIAKLLKRPIILPNIPGFVIRMIFGEMGLILLNGSRVSSKKIESEGFNFDYGDLDKALVDILKGN